MRIRSAIAGIAAVAALGPGGGVALAGPADLDPAFGDGGIVQPIPPNGTSAFYPRGVAIDASGRIVMGGMLGHALVAVRLSGADGSLDTSFSEDGVATVQFPGMDPLRGGVAIDGSKVVVAGTADFRDHGSDFAVARFNDDGTRDGSFSGDGKTVISFGTGDENDESEDVVRAISVLPDGSIVVGGFAKDWQAGASPPVRPAVARLQADGELDPGFGAGGLRLFEQMTGYASGLESVEDGVVVSIDSTRWAAPVTQAGLVAARLNLDGSLDSSFGEDGIARVDLGGDAGARALAVQPDGKVVLAGVAQASETPRFAVARLTTGGDPDPTFSGDGALTTVFGPPGVSRPGKGDTAADVAVQPDGKLVVSGETNTCPTYRPAIARYVSDGTLDPSFSGDGQDLPPIGGYEGAGGLTLQADGRMLVTGSFGGFGSGGVARFGTGTPDSNPEWCPHDLTVNILGPGRVTAPGIDCPGDCTEHTDPDSNRRIYVFAWPDPGFRFVRWSTTPFAYCGYIGDPWPPEDQPWCLLTKYGEATTISAEFAPIANPPPAAEPAPVGEPPPEGDSKAPKTRITRKPRRRSAGGRALLRFVADEAGVSFRCRLSGTGVSSRLREYRPCTSPLRYRHLDPGPKHFRVIAVDEAGNHERKPAKANWRVQRKHGR